jgi:integrase
MTFARIARGELMAKRRGNQEGSIYRTKDGRWRGAVTIGYVAGKPKRKYVSGDTRAEVSAKLTEALRNKDRGLPAIPEKQTLGEFLMHWLENRVRTTVRPSTFAGYESHVRVYLVPCLGHIRLVQLSPQHVQQFLNDRVQDGLSTATIQRIRATLRKALADAQRWDLVARNAAALASPPPSKRPKIRPISASEAMALIEHVRGHRHEALVITALGAGLRMGEILGLRWEDVDFEGRTLTVAHALQRVDGQLVLVPPKSQHSRRTIPLAATVVTALAAHRACQDEVRLVLESEWDERDFVFTTRMGKPLIGSNVLHEFQSILAAAGLPRYRFHDLRHAFASFLLAQGVSMYMVKEILGHSQIALTIDTYAHLSPETKREASDRMEDFLSGRT